MKNHKLIKSIKQLYSLFNNEIINSIKDIQEYYDGIYEISDNILKDLVLENDIEEYFKKLHEIFVELDDIPVLINHIKLFTGIHLILSTSIDNERKNSILKNSFFDINFDFNFIHRHYLLQINEYQYETEYLKNKLIELKQISKSRSHRTLFNTWGKDVYTNLLNLIEG